MRISTIFTERCAFSLFFEMFSKSMLSRAELLQHRRKNSHNRAHERHEYVGFQHIGSDLDAFFHSLYHIVVHSLKCDAFIHPNAVLKMMNKATVVKIYGADHAALTVCKIGLGVYESGLVFIDAHACRH